MKTVASSEVDKLQDKYKNGMAIEGIVKQGELDYLEASTQWMEENSISELDFPKFLPQTIIEKIMDEAITSNRLRPSQCRRKSNTLDFLF
ncbi:late promoter transcriptional regulator [Pseudomonas phage PspYZU05]|uniref:Late transcription coactivator n=1 Tax=Pseudomonas phage PspYZU05 TaxID=1983556 RepID=A0A2U7N559_9CAUD|nr:late promoter transcriptional regulator [Pseudomonas phage PspYZU05]ASD52116.1 late promoter transcription accessory protein [Pseudomonas phage PspYZU05]